MEAISLKASALSMVAQMSQRCGQLDWTVDGGEIVACHSITGRHCGTINLATGEIAPCRPSDAAKMQNILEAVKDFGHRSAAKMELDLLRCYPARNAKAIAALEALAN